MNSSKPMTLAASSLGLIVIMLNVSAVNPALPAIQRGLEGSSSDLSWVVNTYNILFASLLLLGGLLGDRLGHRKVFNLGLGVALLGALFSALAPTIELLLGARALQGVGSALVQPSSLALLVHVFSEPKARTRAIGLWGGVSGLGIALGPLLGGLLVDGLGWRSVFMLIMLVALVALIVSLRWVSETSIEATRALDWWGLVLAIVTLFALGYGLSQGPLLGWFSAPVLVSLGLAVVGLLGFLVVERGQAHPVVALELFTNRGYASANLAALLASFGSFGLLVFLGLYMQQGLGLSATQAGLITLLFPVGFAALSPVSGRLTAQYGARWPATAGLLLGGLTGLFFLQLEPGAGAAQLWWVFLLWGAGIGLSTSALTNAAVGSVPANRAGMASSVLASLRQVGTALGVAVLGATLVAVMVGSLASADALDLSLSQRVLLAREGLGGGVLLEGMGAVQLRAAVESAYRAGLHVAVVVAAVVLLLASGLAWGFVEAKQPPANRDS